MLLTDALVLPFVALIALGVMDRPSRRSVPEWLVHLAWDLCVLAVGAAPAFFERASNGVFTSQGIAIRWLFVYEIVALAIVGTLLASRKALETKSGLDALVSLAISGTLVGFLTYLGWASK